jgi:hypothetical protein
LEKAADFINDENENIAERNQIKKAILLAVRLIIKHHISNTELSTNIILSIYQDQYRTHHQSYVCKTQFQTRPKLTHFKLIYVIM